MRPKRGGVSVAELKARLSAHLRRAEEGRTITILRYGHPVARLVPARQAVTIVKGVGSLRDVKLPHRGRGTTRLVEELLAERRRR